MKILLSVLSAIGLLTPAFSQNLQKAAVEDPQVANAIAVYDRYSAANAPIYNGRQYLYYTFRMEGDPYFNGSDYSYGWVSYQGRKYDSLLLQFDVVRDELVVMGPDKRSPIVLHNEFVDSFSMDGQLFLALQEDHSQNLYNTGFYDLLYNGRSASFLKRTVKILNPKIISNAIITSFLSKTRFYIHKNGLYYLVNNKKDVLRVFSDKGPELKKVMRQNHVRLKKKNFETSATKVTALYDQLTH